MSYTEFHPHPALAPFIDVYWRVTGNGIRAETQHILPDGCVDIILNLGDDGAPDENGFSMKSEGIYLVGTMSHFIETVILPETCLIGIRFKPAGFSFFYKYASLHQFTDLTVEFEKALAPDLRKVHMQPQHYLDHFFFNRLSESRHNLLPVIQDIQKNKGQIGVETLSGNHCTTARQLQRNFKAHIGLTPKEFINVVRYQHAMQKIKTNQTAANLLDIALDCGYYDHSHLTNEIRKYTGVAPTLL